MYFLNNTKHRLYVLVENSEDSISTDDLELIRYLHVPVDGLICLFEGFSLFLLGSSVFISIFYAHKSYRTSVGNQIS